MRVKRRETMKQKRLVSLFVFILILILPNFVLSRSNYKYAPSPKTDIYFGHISYTEVKHDGNDPVVLREGYELAKVAVLNFPLLPGDIIRTTDSRRCEIQFDTGTIIRLDKATELKIETILAKSLSTRKKITNLLLTKGQIYIMYRRYSYPEVFQILTSNTAVKMKHKTVAVIKTQEDRSTNIQVKLGKAYAVYGPDEKNIDERRIKKSERLTISSSHEALKKEYRPYTDFVLWNESMNKNFVELHEGLSYLPKPVQRMPKAIFYFAQKYSNMYGEWVWDGLCGYVWRPHYNDRYPWGNWTPYYYGQWREVNGQLFWVPEEPWGWVPYHLGLWIWNKKYGWVWMPGSAFAPAWVAWDFYFGGLCWRPLSMMDWYYLDGFYGDYYGPFYDAPDESPGEYGKNPLRIIRKAQLKKGETALYNPPKELKKVYSKAVSALKKGDKSVFESLRKIQEYSVVIRKKDLNVARIHGKAIKLQEIPVLKKKELISQRTIKDPSREAVKIYRQNEYAVTYGKKALMMLSGLKSSRRILQNRTSPLKTSTKAVEARGKAIRQSDTPGKDGIALKPYQSGIRFRDWNPDIGIALNVGVSIKYSSRDNEIRCPELGLTSRNVRHVENLVTKTSFSRSGRNYYSDSRVSSSSSSSSSSRSVSSSSVRSAVSSSRGGGSSSGTAKKK